MAIESELSSAQSRFTDKLILLRFKTHRPIILHIEFQLRGDAEMPERMGEYLFLFLRAVQPHRKVGALPACMVVYLDRKHYRRDPGYLRVAGAFDTEATIKYKVVKLWKLDPKLVLELKSPGLAPHLPLMAGNPKKLAIRAREKIQQAPEKIAGSEEKKDLLAALNILAGRVIRDKILLKRLLLESNLMEKNFFLDFAASIGKKAEVRKVIMKILRQRLGKVPRSISKQVAQLDKLKRLEDLVIEAFNCEDFEDFVRLLPNKRLKVSAGR